MGDVIDFQSGGVHPRRATRDTPPRGSLVIWMSTGQKYELKDTVQGDQFLDLLRRDPDGWITLKIHTGDVRVINRSHVASVELDYE